MATFTRFEEIECWQKARELTRLIYQLSSQLPLSKDFEFRDQFRRAGLSIMSNIAERYERGGRGEFLQFLSMAKVLQVK